MSAEMPKMPEPVAWRYMHEGKPIGIHPRTIDRYYRFEGKFIDGEPLYTANQMREYAQEATRQAMETAAKVCHDKYMERAKYEGFSREATTARALELAIRSLLPNEEKRHG